MKSDMFKNDMVPSGKHTKSYWKLPFIVDLPIKNGDFPWFFVCLPDGMSITFHTQKWPVRDVEVAQ